MSGKLILAFLLSASAWSYTINVPKKNYTMIVKSKYGKQWVRVFQEKKNWFCQSNSMPYLKLDEKPSLIDKLPSPTVSQNRHCRREVLIVNRLEDKPKKLKRCILDSSTSRYVKNLQRLCSLGI